MPGQQVVGHERGLLELCVGVFICRRCLSFVLPGHRLWALRVVCVVDGRCVLLMGGVVVGGWGVDGSGQVGRFSWAAIVVRGCRVVVRGC